MGNEDERREGEHPQRILEPRGYPSHTCGRGRSLRLEQTLVQFDLGRRLPRRGASRRPARDRPRGRSAAFTVRSPRDRVVERGTPDEAYESLLLELLGEASDDELDVFIDAEHDAWRPAFQVLGSAQALLESLRSRGIKTGVVRTPGPTRRAAPTRDRAGRADRAARRDRHLERGRDAQARRRDLPPRARRARRRSAAAIFVGDRLDDRRAGCGARRV